MDVDDENATSDWLVLFDPPEAFPWLDPKPQEIEARRAQMTDMLLFDVLLVRGGIRSPDMYYPPTDHAALRRLLDAIQASSYDNLKQDCLVYILLKWYEDGRETRFQEERCIPPQFVSLADAYWFLDTGVNVAKAVSILSDARLNRDYASKILQAISLAHKPSQLIVKYVQTAKPPLTEPDDMDMYAIALAESSLLEAWQYQRSFPDSSETRSRLLKKLLEWCLSPKPRSVPLSHLLAFSLSDYEQKLLHDYALHPPKTIPSISITVVQDLVCVRLIQSGHYADAIKLDRQFSGVVAGRDSDALRVMQDRRRMMDDILATMPVVERNMVEAELNIFGEKTSDMSSSRSKPLPGSTRPPLGDLSMSWEDVLLPTPPVNGSATHVRSTASKPPSALAPQPSIQPRFSLSNTSLRSSQNGSASVPPHQSLFSAPASTKAHKPQTSPLANVSLTHPFSSSLSSSVNAQSASPLVGPSGLQITHGAFQKSISGKSTANGVHLTASLFEKSGSANQTPNAFYKPPVNAGVKRTFDRDRQVSSSMPKPSSKPAETHPFDIDMVSEEENVVVSGKSAPHEEEEEDEIEEAAPAELSFSVFGNTSRSDERQPTRSRESKSNTVPGAFMEEEDSEPETSSQRNGAHRNPVVRSAPSKQHARERRNRDLKEEVDLKSSIPGSLMAEEEEADEVAPLPPSPVSKRPARKGRTSKKDIEGETTSRPRRSSRLSVASSVASSSPEPLSPPKPTKPRKSMRASTTAGISSTSKSNSSRRKR